MAALLSNAATAALVFAFVCANESTAFAQTTSDLWRSADIGAPVLAGTARTSTAVFTIDAAGTGITETSDQFHFVYQPIVGDVEIVAKIDSLVQVNPWTNAGVMIRGSLSANAAHAYAAITAAKGAQMRVRAASGASVTTALGPKHKAPTWLRLLRQGQSVTAYSSVNGTTWATLGSSSISVGSTAYVGIAVTSNSKSMRTTAIASNISVRNVALPQGQQHLDIGTPVLAGNAQFTSGTYTVTSGGVGLSGTADQFHFIFEPLAGDGEVSGRVDGIAGGTAASLTGVMFRETLSAQSRYVAMTATAGNGYAFQRRLDPGGVPVASSGGGGTPPGFLRVLRRGDQFEAYRSADGSTWSLIGVETIAMTETIYVGLAAASSSASSTSVSTVDNLRVSQTAGANRPPAVSLTSPTFNTEIVIPAIVQLEAVAVDPENRLVAVDFYAGSTLLSTDAIAPFTAVWSPSVTGAYPLTAVAHDADGGSTTSGEITVFARAQNTPPIVSLSSSSTLAVAPAVLMLSATASDADGRITRVDFFSGSTLIGSASAAPYTLTWSDVTAGTYALIAVAYDDAGATASSAAVGVTVQPALLAPPRLLVFTASADHETNVTNYVFKVFAAEANVTTATPIAVSDLGKPMPDANREITVDRLAFFGSLAPGQYVATVTASGLGGQTISPALTFAR